MKVVGWRQRTSGVLSTHTAMKNKRPPGILMLGKCASEKQEMSVWTKLVGLLYINDCPV